jgi:hypothetical protein
MLGQKNWLVIMVSKNSLQIFRSMDDSIETLSLPGEIINNMEVVDKDGLYTLITEWHKNHVFISASIIWLLSPEICFDHTFATSEQDKIDSETLQFLDTVPFEQILSRMYKPMEWKQIVAVNKDLIMSLIQSFLLHGYVTRVVVPSKQVLAEAVLTVEVARNTIKHIGELERESLISTSSPVPNVQTISPQPNTIQNKPKSSLPLLLSVFGILLAILAFVIYLNY